MGLPGHRRTSSDKRRRAAHFGLKEGAISECPKCKQPVRPHRACAKCGTYKGRAVVTKGIAKSVAKVTPKKTVKKEVAKKSK